MRKDHGGETRIVIMIDEKGRFYAKCSMCPNWKPSHFSLIENAKSSAMGHRIGHRNGGLDVRYI